MPARTLTWTSTAEADWNTASDWSLPGGGSAVPLTGDTAILSAGTADLIAGVNPAAGVTLDLGGPEPTMGTVNAVLSLNNANLANYTINTSGSGNAGLIRAVGTDVFSGTVNVTQNGALGLLIGGASGGTRQSTSPALGSNSFANNGTINLTGGAMLVEPLVAGTDNALNAFFYAGTINVNAGVLVVGPVNLEAPSTFGSPAVINLSHGGVFQAQDIGQNTNVVFQDGSADAFVLTSTQSSAVISGFQAGDQIIQQAGTIFGTPRPYGVRSYSYNAVTHDFQVTTGTAGTPFLDYIVTGNFTASTIRAAADANGNVIITVACFAAGTRIATTRGEVPVERLEPGDRVVTVGGTAATRPVVWVGHRRIRTGQHPQPSRVRPVRITAGALAEGLPIRDLVVSPDHALFLDGALVAAGDLVNGATIRQDQEAAEIHYVHVELDRHDALLAEGVPAESYLDCGNRHHFANAGPLAAMHPDFARAAAATGLFAPFAEPGPALAAIRQRLHARAEALGFALSSEPSLHVAVAQRRYSPLGQSRLRARFRVDETGDVHIRSPLGVAAETDPSSADRQPRGVRIVRIELTRGWIRRTIRPTDPGLRAGFHPAEADADGFAVWTDGDGVLPEALLPEGTGPLDIEVVISGQQPYWVRTSASGARPVRRNSGRLASSVPAFPELPPA